MLKNIFLVAFISVLFIQCDEEKNSFLISNTAVGKLVRPSLMFYPFFIRIKV